MNMFQVSIGASIDCHIDGMFRQFDIDEVVEQPAQDPLHAMALAIAVAIARWPEGQLHSALVVRQEADYVGIEERIMAHFLNLV